MLAKIMFQLVVALLTLTLAAGACASDLCQEPVRDGRKLAFNDGIPTLAGLRAADICFQEALSSDPSDQEALFFRAITRVLLSVADQAEVIGLNTIRQITRAFEFSWNGGYDTYLPPPPATYYPDTRDAFLQALDDSYADLSTIGDTFTVTLMSHQDHTLFPEIVITYDHIHPLQDMLAAISAAIPTNTSQDWNIIALEQFITDRAASGLPTPARALLYTFLNPFGFASTIDHPIPRPDFDIDHDIDGLELATCAAEMTPFICDPEAPCKCDIDGSGAVDVIDLQLLLAEFPGVY